MAKMVHARLDAETERVLARLHRVTGLGDSAIIRRGIQALAELTRLPSAKRVIGLGRFRSGVRDLGSNAKHLRDFGR